MANLVIIEQTTKDTGRDFPLTILLEKEEPAPTPEAPYVTHVSYDGGTTKFWGHYNLTLDEAVKDYKKRVKQGSDF